MVVTLACSFGTEGLTLETDGLLYVQVVDVVLATALPIAMVCSERMLSTSIKVAAAQT
jgi:hypothetical protein